MRIRDGSGRAENRIRTREPEVSVGRHPALMNRKGRGDRGRNCGKTGET